jgi:ectoine hydroxylase-related dioxygenase (phytanoyl-CoA dioxygenase family)
VRVAPFRSVAHPGEAPRLVRARAERHGYLFCPGLIPRRTVQALRRAALAVARQLNWLDGSAPPRSGQGAAGIALGAYDDPRWIEFLRVMLGHPAFAALRAEPRLRAMLETILGAPPEPDAGDLLRVVSADDPSHTTVAHQDRFYLPGVGPRWTAWVPLGACPLSLGPIAVWPLSHARGSLRHHGPRDWQQAVDVPARAVWAAQDLKAGDVVLFSWLTVHRALPNRAGRRLRFSATCRYRAAGSR